MIMLCKQIATAILLVLLGVAVAISFRAIKYSEYILPIIDDIEATQAYKNISSNPDKFILIDVRSEGEYARAHASSSVNLPIHYFYDDTHGIVNEKGIGLPKNTDKTIYLLCTGGRLAGVAYSYLEHYGYRNIQRIKHGLGGWTDAGLPVISEDIFKSIFDTSQTTSQSQPLDKPFLSNPTIHAQ